MFSIDQQFLMSFRPLISLPTSVSKLHYKTQKINRRIQQTKETDNDVPVEMYKKFN